ncbi:Alpha/Beta hydrolase protein [Podospora didyma]|uniref:Alpha/Beta hydrolase protein n=1 Tax=Podospora didyma TaxID=330526 RepID=A0AAE0NGB4_9PEZI|nr:Alpha/Beta hydrolase protein [Podospora didyma]
MPITTDITVDASKFDPKNITDETIKLNTYLEGISTSGPKWNEVGIAKYRLMREAGETPLPPPIYLPEAEEATVPSRDADRAIPIRVYTPDNGQLSKGIFLHIHGGGFVLATHQHQDGALQRYANKCQLTAISVGYRLAPENPWPAAIHDCFDAAEYLVDHGPSVYGSKLLFICGESAGSCLAAATAFHLIRARPGHQLAGLIFPYGQFDVTLNLPSMALFERPLLINREIMQEFADAYTPGMSIAERRNPLISPLYDDLGGLARGAAGGKFPPALFLCGTEDPLLDDTLLMSTKWMATGSEAVVKIYAGAAHGFTLFPGYQPAEEACALTLQFVNEKLDACVS